MELEVAGVENEKEDEESLEMIDVVA